MEIRNVRIYQWHVFPLAVRWRLASKWRRSRAASSADCSLNSATDGATDRRQPSARRRDRAGRCRSLAACLRTTRPPTSGLVSAQYPEDGLMYHGPGSAVSDRRCLSIRRRLGTDYVAPTLQNLLETRGGEGWIVPISVLDACVVACGGFLFMHFGGMIEVPYEFERLRIARLPRSGRGVHHPDVLPRARREVQPLRLHALYGEGDEPLLRLTDIELFASVGGVSVERVRTNYASLA